MGLFLEIDSLKNAIFFWDPCPHKRKNLLYKKTVANKLATVKAKNLRGIYKF